MKKLNLIIVIATVFATTLFVQTVNAQDGTDRAGLQVRYYAKLRRDWNQAGTFFNNRRNRDNEKAFGIYTELLLPQSALEINTNFTHMPNYLTLWYNRGDVFRTNAPITLNTFWRMERGGFARGKIFSRGVGGTVVLGRNYDQNNFSIQADTFDITFHTGPISADGIGQERMRILGVNQNLTTATPWFATARAGNVGIGTQHPLTMLQIGGEAASGAGWRTWMDIGTYYASQNGFDNAYFGLRNIANDQNNAVINWGNNPAGGQADRLLFTFTAAPGNGQASTFNGLETARMIVNLVGANTVRSFTGIGGDPAVNTYFGNSQDPTNTLEINSPAATAIPGSSGLRFTDLRSTSTPITNPSSNFLSVDANGDVILVSAPPASSAFFSCTNPAADMPSDSKFNLNDHNFYFEGFWGPNNKVGIGYPCGAPLEAKLEVFNINSDPTTHNAGKFYTFNPYSYARGILGIALGSQNQNFGVCGHVDFPSPTAWNVAIHGEATGASHANIGGWFEAGGSQNFNCAVFGIQGTGSINNDWAGWFDGRTFTPTGTWSGSDSIFKNNISPVSNALSNIRQLQPRTFTFNNEEYPYMGFPSGTQYGLVAQEVEPLYPELVSTITRPERRDTNGTILSPQLTFKGLNYTGLIPVLTAGVKQLDSTVQQLDSAVAELQNQPQGGVAGNNGQTNYLAKWQNADTLTNSQLYDNGTNVGLGTTSPTTLLHLSKTDGFVSYPGGAGSVSTLLSEQNITNTSAFATLSPSAFQTTINSLDASTSVVNGLTSNTTIPSANSSNASSLQIRGGAFRASHNGTGSINSATGAILNATNRGNGSITYLYGSVNGVNNISDGHVNLAIGGYFQRNNQGTGTVTDAIGVFIDALRYNAGTITNTYGLYIMHQKPPYEVATGTQINNPYGIYQTGVNDYNYFAGNTGIGTSAPSEKLYVAGNIFATGTITQNSDANLKQNITRFTNGMNIIRQLKPYTFNFDTSYHYLNLPAGKQYGMTAQDVEPILPELVTNSFYPDVKDTLGNIISPRIDYKGLNYTAFIPILIQGMKQLDSTQKVQDSTNAALKTRVKELEDLLAQSDKEDKKTKKWNTNKQVVELSSINSIILNQNDPNPFAEQTTITYFIPDEANNVEIIFYTNTGTVIKKVAIHEKGEGSLQIYASNLSDGIYVYSILADEKVIDTKKMMKAK